MGAQSYSFRKFSFEDSIACLKDLGLNTMEFCAVHFPPDADDENFAHVKATVEAAGVDVACFGVEGFSADDAANRKKFEFAKALGIQVLTADPAPDSFDSLDALCAEFGVKIGIHNHGPGALFDKSDDTLNAVKDHDKRIGACVDTGHYIRSDENPVDVIRKLGDRVFALHIKDDTHKGDKGSHNVVIGQANLDVVGVFKALKDIKFPADGSISLEYESNPDNPIEDMKDCLAVARESIAKAAS